MGIDLAVLRGQFQDLIASTEKLSPKERERHPSPHYAGRFNSLLALAKESAPSVDARLWPEPVGKTVMGPGMEFANAHYPEFETYSRQIIALLNSV